MTFGGHTAVGWLHERVGGWGCVLEGSESPHWGCQRATAEVIRRSERIERNAVRNVNLLPPPSTLHHALNVPLTCYPQTGPPSREGWGCRPPSDCRSNTPPPQGSTEDVEEGRRRLKEAEAKLESLTAAHGTLAEAYNGLLRKQQRPPADPVRRTAGGGGDAITYQIPPSPHFSFPTFVAFAAFFSLLP